MSGPEKKRKPTKLVLPPMPESTPEKKSKTATVLLPTLQPIQYPSLPNDLLLSCIARVSRLYYPILSLVSKRLRSLLVSLELNQTRYLLGHATESCLYVCLQFPPDPNPSWYTLCRIPDRRKKNSSGNLLVPVPIPSPAQLLNPNLVAVGSNIYKIGGDVPSSSRVSVLDCKTHTWHQAPSMRMVRNSNSTVNLLDGKIYAAGGCDDHNSMNWIECFDPKTQVWSSVTSPDSAIRDGGVVNSLGLGGEFYLFGKKWSGIYNPKEGRWRPIGFPINMGIAAYYSYCVIDNVLFFWHDGLFQWYDSNTSYWMRVKGVEGLPDSRYCGFCKMVDYRGKMVVFWDEYDGYHEYMIWCAEIALERRGEDQIWGQVEWFDVVLTTPKSCHLDALSATGL